MGTINRHRIAITTNASGEATAFSSDVICGLVHAVVCVSGLSTAARFTVTSETGGLDILNVAQNSSVTQDYYPRKPANTSASGVFDPAGNTSGKAPVQIPLASERAKVVVASGGNALSAFLDLYVDGI